MWYLLIQAKGVSHVLVPRGIPIILLSRCEKYMIIMKQVEATGRLSWRGAKLGRNKHDSFRDEA